MPWHHKCKYQPSGQLSLLVQIAEDLYECEQKLALSSNFQTSIDLVENKQLANQTIDQIVLSSKLLNYLDQDHVLQNKIIYIDPLTINKTDVFFEVTL